MYDGHLPEEILSHIKSLEYPRRKYEERAVHGCEFDHVITISSGYLETFSRAKITLGIITMRMENSEEKQFPSLLQTQVEQGLLIKENAEDEEVYDDHVQNPKVINNEQTLTIATLDTEPITMDINWTPDLDGAPPPPTRFSFLDF